MQEDASRFIPTQVARFAERWPDAPALTDVAQARSLSFRELAQALTSARTELAQLGPLTRRIVLLPSENSVEKLIHWLAVWSLGGTVMNLDSRHVPHHFQHALIEAIQPDLILHDPVHGPRAVLQSGQSRNLLEPDSWRPVPDRRSCSLPDGAILINTTTGTSGAPKLVYHGFRALLHHGACSARFLALQEQEACLETRSFNWFSAQILSLMPFLLLGTRLHIAPHFSASTFHEWLDRYPIRYAATVPTILNALLPPTGAAKTPPPRRQLTRLSCSSAPLGDQTWLRAEAAFGIPVINLYGSSEAGWLCGTDAAQRRIGSVGYPAPGAVIELLDPVTDKLKQEGEGRLRVCSDYLALAVRSLEQAVPQPLDGRLMIADHARIDTDGRVYLMGRTDDVINRGGIKIHPAVVEDCIERHPRVKQAVVFGVDDERTGQAIACAVVGEDPFDLAALKDFIERDSGLPASHRPVHWWPMQAIPQIGNGKISRQLLARRFRKEQGLLTNGGCPAPLLGSR